MLYWWPLIKKSNLLWLFIIINCLLSYNANAQKLNTIKATIKITKIHAKQFSEKNGDEIYFAVTDYFSNGSSNHQRIPYFPQYFRSRDLSSLRDLTLWEKEILPNESVQIIISLIEQDMVPFNPDDALGSIKLVLQNNNGKLKKKWMQAEFNDNTKAIKVNKNIKSPQYIFKTKNSEYILDFSVTG